MSQLTTIIVLAPNGRRQTFKVSTNTTILQILEEVCAKQGFEPLEYDIKHHNRILDTTMTVQYLRLPNNAQVEMVKAKTVRKEAEVLVSVQIESGERINGTFFPTETLWNVVEKLHPPMEDNKQPTMLYMRQEFRGEHEMKNSTLRSLGLTSGRVMFRFMNRPLGDNSQQSQQPSTSTQLPHHSNRTSNLPSQGASTIKQSQAQRSNPSPLLSKSGPKIEREKKVVKSETKESSPPHKSSPPSVIEKEKVSASKTVIPCSSKKQNSLEQKILAEIRERKASTRESEVTIVDKRTSGKKSDSSANKTTSPKFSSVQPLTQKKNETDSNDEKIRDQSSSCDPALPQIPSTAGLLGPNERQPVVYSRKMQRHVSSEDLPDEFFELTIDDVKYLYRDLKSKNSGVGEMPLQTSALRKLEESKRVLNQLNKYKRTVLRIEFPDQNVLQGTFSSVETVENVCDFVREYLEDPTISFYLYTTPPKEILPHSATLIEANCVPCALLHFGVKGSCQEEIHFLKQKVLTQLTSLEVASAAALRSRGIKATCDDPAVPSTSGETRDTKDKSSDSSGHENQGKVAGNPNGKVPKWFKLTPK